MRFRNFWVVVAIMTATTVSAFAEEIRKDTFIFNIGKELPITPVKNQANTGTCWSFSALGFFESELLRMGKPLDELMQVFDYALDNNFPVAWASDVSEKGFTRKGVAVNPEVKVTNLPGSDQAKWLGLSQREIEEKIYKIAGPQPETEVTPEIRQLAYDDYRTTDDHGMVIYGIAHDQAGNKYYLVKNSWGTDSPYKGIWYASESFVKHKTINILVHKDAIPSGIREKLKL